MKLKALILGCIDEGTMTWRSDQIRFSAELRSREEVGYISSWLINTFEEK